MKEWIKDRAWTFVFKGFDGYFNKQGHSNQRYNQSVVDKQMAPWTCRSYYVFDNEYKHLPGTLLKCARCGLSERCASGLRGDSTTLPSPSYSDVGWG